jgi:hypothetical protein
MLLSAHEGVHGDEAALAYHNTPASEKVGFAPVALILAWFFVN